MEQEGFLEEAAFEVVCKGGEALNTRKAGGCESLKGRLVVSRGTLSLRSKLTPATRSISAMSCQACSAARWRGVCCLWERNQGDREINGRACRRGLC